MKSVAKVASALVSFGLCTAIFADHVLFLSANSANIRYSTDFGLTWANFINISGAGFRGLAGDPVTGTLFAYASGQGSPASRPVYAYSVATTSVLSSITVDEQGTSNQRPMIYHNGFLYIAPHQTNFYSTWDGTSLGPVSISFPGTWTPNDLAIGGSGGTNYYFMNGTSGNTLRRRILIGDGTTTNQVTVSFTGLSGADIFDLAITPGGRMLVLTVNGLFASGLNQIHNTSISVSPILTFAVGASTASDPASGARELILYNNNLYIAATTRFYRYSYDDTSGTASLIHSADHGFNLPAIQLTVIPEPSTLLLLGLAFGSVALYRRHIRS